METIFGEVTGKESPYCERWREGEERRQKYRQLFPAVSRLLCLKFPQGSWSPEINGSPKPTVDPIEMHNRIFTGPNQVKKVQTM